MNGQISPRVFLCYAKQDASSAQALYHYLKMAGASPWLDIHNLTLGDEWEPAIKQAVASSDAFVVCLRPGFDEIGFRQKEVRWAIEAVNSRPPGRGFIIPFLILPCRLPGWCACFHAGRSLDHPSSPDDLLIAIEKHCGGVLDHGTSPYIENFIAQLQMPHSDLREAAAQAHSVVMRGMVNELGGPMAQIEGALARCDARLWQDHSREMASLPSDYGFIQETLSELSNDVEAARRRLDFEVKKLIRGTEIAPLLQRPRGNMFASAGGSARNDEVSLWSVVIDAFSMYRRELDARNMRIDQHIDDTLLKGRVLSVDREAIELCIANLVDNAVKYSFDGSVIAARLFGKEAEGRAVCVIELRNLGNGILADEVERVLGRFYRGKLSSTRTHRTSGAGIGLFIAKAVAEAYGGSITVSSCPSIDRSAEAAQGFWTTVCLTLLVS